MVTTFYELVNKIIQKTKKEFFNHREVAGCGLVIIAEEVKYSFGSFAF